MYSNLFKSTRIKLLKNKMIELHNQIFLKFFNFCFQYLFRYFGIIEESLSVALATRQILTKELTICEAILTVSVILAENGYGWRVF